MNDKNSVLERLSRRDAQRLEKIHKAHKAKEETDACNENDDYFAGVFKTKSDNIEAMLAQVPTLETAVLHNHFDIIKNELNELQKYVVTSSLFLKEFNMRKYLGIVQNLQTNCYEMEEVYIPRKKFGFTKKKLPIMNLKEKSVDELDNESSSESNKWNENLFGFDSRENEVLHLKAEDSFRKDVNVRNLRNSTVILNGVLGTLHMSNLQNCVIVGHVTTSVFVENCFNCSIVVACQQLRMHTSKKCDIYLHVTSKGIIEDCTEIRTAPYNFVYDDLDKDFSLSGLDRGTNNWDELDDFNWLAPDVASPNWKIMEPVHRISNWSDRLNKIPSEIL